MAQGKIDRNGRLHEPPGSEKGGNFAPENGVKTVNDSAKDKSIKQLERIITKYNTEKMNTILKQKTNSVLRTLYILEKAST